MLSGYLGQFYLGQATSTPTVRILRATGIESAEVVPTPTIIGAGHVQRGHYIPRILGQNYLGQKYILITQDFFHPAGVESEQTFGTPTLFAPFADYQVGQRDHKYATPHTVRDDSRMSNVRLRLDGLGGGVGTALVRAFVYDVNMVLVGVSDEERIASGDESRWVTFRFAGEPVPRGDYFVGFILGGDANVMRFRTRTGGRSRWNADAYANGPTVNFGPAGRTLRTIEFFACSFEAWAAPHATDRYYGRLPLAEGQEALFTSPLPAISTMCGWHGDKTDVETGSFAIVRRNGPLVDLLGHRIRVTPHRSRKSIVAFVHNEADVLDDLSLTRRLYTRIAVGADDPIHADVEVLT